MELNLTEAVYANSAIIDRIWELENEGIRNEEYEILSRLTSRMVGFINTVDADDFADVVLEN